VFSKGVLEDGIRDSMKIGGVPYMVIFNDIYLEVDMYTNGEKHGEVSWDIIFNFKEWRKKIKKLS